MQISEHFLKTFAILTVSLLLVVGSINFLTNPFRFFGVPEVSGFNKDKTEYGKYARMIKAHEVRLLRPRGLILGSSRAEFGLDPDHPGWEDSSLPVFNLALPSGSIYEAFKYLQHAHSLGSVRQVVLGLDLFMFNIGEQIRPDFSVARLSSKSQNSLSFGWLRDMVTTLFSYDALSASFSTITRQNEADFVPYLSNGARHTSRNWEKIKKKGGHRKAVLSNERYSVTARDGWPYFSFTEADGNSLPTIEIFESLIEFCRAQDIDLKIFISPIHARKLEVKKLWGLWSTFEQWKRELVKVLVADAVSHPDQAPYDLWDFSGYNSITTEDVPALGDKKTQMRWYWEGSHYRKETGDKVLDLILGGNGRMIKKPRSDFGVLLTQENIDAHLLSIIRAEAKYAATNLDDIDEIKSLIDEIRPDGTLNASIPK